MSDNLATVNYPVLISRFSSSEQWDRVLGTAQEWLSVQPENIHAHLAAGRALVNLERYPEAEPHLVQVLAWMPDYAVAHRFMSIVHFNQKKFAAADASIQKAISLQPGDAFNWYHLAWMFYRHGDLASARKYAEKARTINPRNAAIVNLIGMCQPDGKSSDSTTSLEHYRRALELNPESAVAHNNIGVHYLNVMKDFPAAEAQFRRALFFDPTLKVARSNLFLALKHSDRVYRFLCAPRDFLIRVWALAGKARKQNFLLYLLAIPVWLLAFRFVLGGLLLWGLFVWPLVKVYEFLIIGDLRSQAGEIGARRGGLFGYRRWPLRLRLAIFCALLFLFWGSMAWLGLNEKTQPLFWLIMAIIGMVLLAMFALRLIDRSRHRSHSRGRAKALRNVIESPAKKSFWKFFRR